MTAKMVTFDLWEEEGFLAGLRCVSGRDGGLCVMMGGPYLMLKWCANNSASFHQVSVRPNISSINLQSVYLQGSHTMCLHTLVKELAQSY